MVSTLDFESSDPSSNLGRTWTVFTNIAPNQLMLINVTFTHHQNHNFQTKNSLRSFHWCWWKSTSSINRLHLSVLDSIVVSIPACHAGDRGSIPRRGDYFLDKNLRFLVHGHSQNLRKKVKVHYFDRPPTFSRRKMIECTKTHAFWIVGALFMCPVCIWLYRDPFRPSAHRSKLIRGIFRCNERYQKT